LFKGFVAEAQIRGAESAEDRMLINAHWNNEHDLTPTQAFLKEYYDTHYLERHRPVKDSGETEMINYHTPEMCPFCYSEIITKHGKTKCGVQRYQCRK
jgi:hypothetical protein